MPNANTMWCTTSASAGTALSLRGPGRRSPEGHCYLLVPDTIDAEAEERLKVLEHHTDLGSGYRIALRDLELRGAGNLLGAEQSGHAQAVGFDLYLRWLEETVRSLRGQGTVEQPAPPDVVLDHPAHLPDGYVPDDDVKLDLYRRLARSASSGEIDGLRDELRERFGPLPAAVETLLDMTRLRVMGAALGLQNVLVRETKLVLPSVRDHSQAPVSRLHWTMCSWLRSPCHRSAVLRLLRLGGEPNCAGVVRALGSVVIVAVTIHRTTTSD